MNINNKVKKYFYFIGGYKTKDIIVLNYRLDLHKLGVIEIPSAIKYIKSEHTIRSIGSIFYNNILNDSSYYCEVTLNIPSDYTIIDNILNKYYIVYIKQLNSDFLIVEAIYSDSTNTMKLKLLKQ